MMPKISIVIPVYNTQEYLEQCLDSVLGQTMADLEVICVDDCSKDSSYAIMERYHEKDPRVKIFRFDTPKSALQARKTGLICLACSLAVCAAVAAVFHAFPRQLLGLFTDDPTVVEVSVPYLKFVSWILFPKAVNNVIGLCIRGLGDTRWMLLTQIFGTCFMVLGGYYLILVSGLGLSGIFLTLLLDEALRGTANLIRFLCCRAVLPRCL
jgi:glycosyltransferase involved in cell wall biosynthesis